MVRGIDCYSVFFFFFSSIPSGHFSCAAASPSQRAVLAEKELSVLKEQFEESSKRLSSDQANEAPPPTMDTPLDVMGRPSLLELAAKEKEVS